MASLRNALGMDRQLDHPGPIAETIVGSLIVMLCLSGSISGCQVGWHRRRYALPVFGLPAEKGVNSFSAAM